VGCPCFPPDKKADFFQSGAYTDFRVYHIDIHTATLRFLATITRSYYCFDFHATGDFLVTGHTDQGNYLVTIQRIPFASNTPVDELMMNFGPDLVRKILFEAKVFALFDTGNSQVPV
jgi:hypothetical protein